MPTAYTSTGQPVDVRGADYNNAAWMAEHGYTREPPATSTTPPPVPPSPLPPPQAYTPGQDLFFGNAGTYSPPLDRRQNHFRVVNQVGAVTVAEVLLQDLSGGLGVVKGPFSQFNDRVTKSTNDTRFPGHLRLNSVTDVDTGKDTEVDTPMSHVEQGNILHIGQASGTVGECLFHNYLGSFTAVDYSPASNITNLASIIIGGVTQPKRIAVCREGGAVQVGTIDYGVTNTFTVDGTMHANTNPCYGILQTFLNTQTMLIYANGLLYTLAASAAIGDAPTSTGTVLQNGGHTISIKKLEGAPYRAFFAVPQQTTSGGALVQGGAAGVAVGAPRLNIIHTNLEGTDPQEMKLNIPFVRATAEIGQGFVFSDGYTVWLHTGVDEATNLGFGSGREIVASRDLLVQTLWGIENRLFAGIIQRSSNRPEAWWIEEFDFRTRQWHQITAVSTGTDEYELAVGRSAPVSNFLKTLYAHSRTQWQYVRIGPQDVDPYAYSRSALIDYDFEATGSTETAAWLLPGYEGLPLTVGEIDFLGDPVEGGTDAKVGVTPAIQTASGYSFPSTMTREFHQRDRWENNHAQYPEGSGLTQRLKLKIDLTRGSDTNDSPDGLPVKLRLYIYTDGKFVPPNVVEPERYGPV